MGLDIGIIQITYLPRPQGIAYRFAWEMAVEASTNGYMSGEGNNWAAFTQRQVLLMLDRFIEERGFSQSEKRGVLEWIRSLPWDGWRDDLESSSDSPDEEEDDDFNPALDRDEERDGGLIELHFNW